MAIPVPVLKQTTEFRIEKGIQLPTRSGGRPSKYPFRDMEVGDSFFVAGEGSTGSAANSARAWARAHSPRQMKAMSVDGGVRIWRTA